LISFSSKEIRDHAESKTACEGHTYKGYHDDVTIQTCWDADRLDLGRVGITPDPDRMCTGMGRQLALAG